MEQWVDKNRKTIFYLVVVVCFFAILIFNIFTPNMSDDLGYGAIVKQANSFWDLFGQEYEHHMMHSGRNVAHLILRIFLYQGNKVIFNIFNALVFTLISFEIYWNASKRKPYNISLYVIIQLLLWAGTIRIDETMIWEDGSCNYMWTMAFILGFITVYRRCLAKSKSIHDYAKVKKIFISVGMLLLGILAGWSNENNSGGCFLLAISFLAIAWKEIEKDAWVYTGPVGVLIGIALMLSSPGNWVRDDLDGAADKYTGIAGIISHFIKATATMRRLFSTLIIILVALVVVMIVRKAVWQEIRTIIVWTVCGFLTGYVLILTAEPVDRAYFGMGIFLIVAIADAVSLVCTDADYKPIRWLELTVVIVGCLWLTTTWIQESTNLARIYRDYNERSALIEKEMAAGEIDLVLPKVHPQFDNRYTFAYKIEIEEDPSYWVNLFYVEYYGIRSVRGVDRDVWEEQYAEKWR